MSDEWKRRMTIATLRWLPKHLLSRMAGHVVAWRLPAPLQCLQIRSFGHAFGVNFEEVRDPIESFRSFQDFFVRALKEEARPIDAAPDAFVAPCDGTWGAAGGVEQGTLLQMKGRPYSLAALLGSERAARPFGGGTYATFYLSPRDYHRVHTPCAVHVAQATYIPGTLWPVNRVGVGSVDSLFAQNERICAFMQISQGRGGGMLCMVAVAATMVGKVRVSFDDLTTNRLGGVLLERLYEEPGHYFQKGAEWGRFEFGSTVVMIATPGLVDLDRKRPGAPLRMGTRIGRLLPRPDPART